MFDLKRQAVENSIFIDNITIHDIQTARGGAEMQHRAEVILYTDGKLFKVLKNRGPQHNVYVMYNKYTKGEILELIMPRYNRVMGNEELINIVSEMRHG